MTSDLADPALYFNRELSWLAFNERVLDEAEAKGWPLLERVKFLSIFWSNLDEFFMIRVSGLHEQLEAALLEHQPRPRHPARAADAHRSDRAPAARIRRRSCSPMI